MDRKPGRSLKRFSLLLLVPCLFLAPIRLRANEPGAVRVQGLLTDRASGTPMPAQGVFNMSFAIWDNQFGGMRITSIGPLPIQVVGGRFEVEIPFGSGDFEAPDRYIEITVNTELLTPRLKLVSIPFAFHSSRTEKAASADLALSVAPSSVGASALVPGAVGSFALAPGAVTADKLGISCAVGEALVRGS